MSRHVTRRERWSPYGPAQYRSVEGLLVRRYKGEWWADVAYKLRQAAETGAVSGWEAHLDRLGPFKRPRNAMVEAERHATLLRNRHRDGVRFGTAEEL